MIVKLSCDIICKKFTKNAAYRLWFDDILLSERKYICKPGVEFIREQCEINASPGLHEIRLEPLTEDKFLLYKTKIDGRVIAFSTDKSASFKISV